MSAMASSFRRILLVGACAFGLSTAQFPTKPEGISILKSKFHKGITISYKEVYIDD